MIVGVHIMILYAGEKGKNLQSWKNSIQNLSQMFIVSNFTL